jgi:hypothetical protein
MKLLAKENILKARQTEVQITLSQKEGDELKNQLIKLLGGNDMPLLDAPLKGTPLAHLFEILSVSFQAKSPT